MKNKIVKLHSKNPSSKKKEINYSDLLNEFVKPFENNFSPDLDIYEKISFTVNAWNMGCMSLTIPQKEFNQMLNEDPIPEPEGTILKKLIKRKKEKFADYNQLIQDFSLNETDGRNILTVTTMEMDDYLASLMEASMENYPEEGDDEPGYINRFGITVRGRKPLFDWMNKLYPDVPVYEQEESSIYLVHETDEYFQDWLKINYDWIFQSELENWHTNENDWPQKRTYKMFMQWFDVDICTMVYDMEHGPIYKND
jgi:hypothetical protein